MTSATTLERPAATPGRTAASRIARFDARGCPVSTRSQAALEHAESAQRSLVSFAGDPIAALDAAIAADPGWALPHVMKANGLFATTERGFSRLAYQCLQQAIALGDAANDRERAHIAASRLLAAGRWDDACVAWERILVDEPQDLVALGFAHAFDFFRGDAANLRRRVERVLPRWSGDAPLRSFAVGMHAFGLEENQLYDAALDAGLAALDGDRGDAWAVHAVAHVHEMRGADRAGSDWIDARVDDWTPSTGLAFHLWWHQALFHVERGELARALALVDAHVVPDAATALQRIDVTAMLWRLMLLGVDVGDRFDAIADAWAAVPDEAGFYAFNDLHAMLAAIGAGRLGEAAALIDAVAARGAEPHAVGAMAREVGVPLLRGVLAHARGHYAAATETLLAVREVCHRFGGSHAQRDIVTLTLLDAAIRGGRHALAGHLLNERALFKAGTANTEAWARRIR